MERVGTLINKLKEQFEQHENAEKLAYTAQLLLVELQQKHAPSQAGSKISVVLPAGAGSFPATLPFSPAEEVSKQETIVNNWLFDAVSDIPTLSHQEPIPVSPQQENPEVKVAAKKNEFNTLLAQQNEILNEKLKEERVEVVTALQDAPIRDLKKAIGFNDRFLFVKELFRGDENMYERSLKTINGFSIYPEAEYWIQRELKVKLSWPDNCEAVRLFDQLVKRRFASI